MKEFLKEYIAHLFLIASALSILIMLIYIAIYGRVVVYETRSWLLGLEIAWAVCAVALGVERGYSTLKRRFS